MRAMLLHGMLKAGESNLRYYSLNWSHTLHPFFLCWNYDIRFSQLWSIHIELIDGVVLYFLRYFSNLLWFQLPRFPSSVASLSFNQGGQLLAIASSYTYLEANEMLVVLLSYLFELFDFPIIWIELCLSHISVHCHQISTLSFLCENLGPGRS